MTPSEQAPDRAEAAAGDDDREDRAATISRLFREHNRTLVGFLRARLQNEQEAKEIAQEAYVKLLQLDEGRARGFLRAYLFRVAANLAVDRLRQRRSRSRLDQLDVFDDFLEDATAERTAIARQELALLREAVDELPDKCRRAFQLHKLEDRPFPEVAAAMGLSERMVRKYIARALIYIRLRREGVSAAEAQKRTQP